MQPTGHPQLCSLDALYRSETQPFRKIHRMIDLLEAVIKTHAAVLIGVYFRRHRISDEVKQIFSLGLATPSLGRWQSFSRVLFDELALNELTQDEYEQLEAHYRTAEQKEKLRRLYARAGGHYELAPYETRSQTAGYRKFLLQAAVSLYQKGAAAWLERRFAFDPTFLLHFPAWDRETDDVIHIRNRYAHGATPPDDECLQDVARLEPVREKWLRSGWLLRTAVVARSRDPGILLPLDGREPVLPAGLTTEQVDGLLAGVPAMAPVLLAGNGSAIELFPILYCAEVDSAQGGVPLLFYNDLRKYKAKAVSYLHYPLAKHILDHDSFDRFLVVFDIQNWRDLKRPGLFDSLLDELSEGFQGRVEELKAIGDFVRTQERGFFVIEGEPGIGKSALTSQALRDEETDESCVVIRYFVRRSFSEGEGQLLHVVNGQLEQRFGLSLPREAGLDGLRSELHLRLTHASEALGGKKLVVMIDGMDERLEADEGRPSAIVSSTYRHVLFVYTTRHAAPLLASLPAEHVRRMKLGGLTAASIRAILSETVSKYEIDRESPEIGHIVDKSKGNPLFVKLLCRELAEGHIRLRDVSKFGSGLDQFYKANMSRFLQNVEFETAMELLFVFAAAKDTLSVNDLISLPGFALQQVTRGLADIGELLHETDNGHYQLFHESLREFLLAKYEKPVMDAGGKLLQYCRSWRVLGAYQTACRYPFEHLTDHLLESGLDEEAATLALDDTYRREQLKRSGTPYAALNTLLGGIRACARLKDRTQAIAVCLQAMGWHNGLMQELGDQGKALRTGPPDLVLADIRGRLIDDGGRCVLYFALLASVIGREAELKTTRELLVQVLRHMDETLSDSVRVNDYISGHVVYWVLVILFMLGGVDAEAEAIRSRTDLDALLVETDGPYYSANERHRIRTSGSAVSHMKHLPDYYGVDLTQEASVADYFDFHHVLFAGHAGEASLLFQLYYDIDRRQSKEQPERRDDRWYIQAVHHWKRMTEGRDKAIYGCRLFQAGYLREIVPPEVRRAVLEARPEWSELGEFEEAFESRLELHLLHAVCRWLAGDVQVAFALMDEAVAGCEERSGQWISPLTFSTMAYFLSRYVTNGLLERYLETANDQVRQALGGYVSRDEAVDREADALTDFAADLEHAQLAGFVTAADSPPLDAIDLTSEFEDDGERFKQFERLAVDYAENGRPDLALALVKRVWHHGRRIEIIDSLLPDLLDNGHYEEALQCAGNMPDAYHKQDAYVQIAIFFGENDMFDRTLATLRCITDGDYRRKVLRELSGYSLRRTEFEQAVELLLLMLERGPYQLETDHHQVLAVATVQALLDRNRLEEAQMVLEKRVTEGFIRMDLTIELGRRYIARKEYEQAAALSAGTWSDELVMQDIVVALAGENEVEQAKAFIARLPHERDREWCRGMLEQELERLQRAGTPGMEWKGVSGGNTPDHNGAFSFKPTDVLNAARSGSLEQLKLAVRGSFKTVSDFDSMIRWGDWRPVWAEAREREIGEAMLEMFDAANDSTIVYPQTMSYLAKDTREDADYWHRLLTDNGRFEADDVYLRHLIVIELENPTYQLPLSLFEDIISRKGLLGFYLYMLFYKSLVRDEAVDSRLAGIIDLSDDEDLLARQTAAAGQAYTFDRYEEWIGTIADEAVRDVISGLYRLTKADKRTAAQFNEAVRGLLE